MDFKGLCHHQWEDRKNITSKKQQNQTKHSTRRSFHEVPLFSRSLDWQLKKTSLRLLTTTSLDNTASIKARWWNFLNMLLAIHRPFCSFGPRARAFQPMREDDFKIFKMDLDLGFAPKESVCSLLTSQCFASDSSSSPFLRLRAAAWAQLIPAPSSLASHQRIALT